MAATKRPAPLTPDGCTMGGNEWFPLHHRRLRKSKWWRRASDLARARNVMLWGEAYDASPAGSLLDDDDELAEAAGFGMDVDGFIRVKAEILAPWVLCYDGRWYHPTLCEVVLEVWEAQSEKRRQARQRQAARRTKVRVSTTGYEDGHATEQKVTRDLSGVTKSFRRGEEKREEKKESPLPPKGGERDDLFEQAFNAFPQSGRSATNRLKAQGEWDVACKIEPPGRLIEAAKAFAVSDIATTEGGKRVPSFHRWLRESRFLAWLPRAAATFPGPPEVRAAVVAAENEAFAVGYLDLCSWRDLPERAITCGNGYVLDKLWATAGDRLRDLGVIVVKDEADGRAA